VDDDEDILDLMRQLLEGQPYRVASTVDGQEALEALDSDPPDLIMLDLLMPRMDGFEFLEALRESGHSIPVIVLTAKTLTASDSDLLEGRVQGILRKNGLDQKRLLEELQQTMESFRSQLHPTQGQPAAEGNS
jgi:CheY-like chemotaxis protein